MDFSENSIKKILALVFTLVISTQILMAQNGLPALYEVEILSHFEMKVSIKPSSNTSSFNYYVFPNSIPNYYQKKSFRNKISDFKVKTNNQFSLYELQGDTVFLPPNFNEISYLVHLDSFKKTEFLPVQSASNVELKLLNIPTFLAYINSISLPMQLNITENGKTLYSQMATYEAFQENPICLGCQKQKIPINNKGISVQSYQNILDQKSLNNIIADAFYAFDNMAYEGDFAGKQLIIILDTLSAATGAIAHKNTIVFYFNEGDAYTIQKTIIHELIHWAVPDLNTWLNEGVAEFLAIKMMRKSALITEERFLNIMATKMREAAFFEDYSLPELYANRTQFTEAVNYRALYSKGAVMSWLLDLIIFEHSNMKLSLESYVLNGIEDKGGVDKSYLMEKIIAFENDYVATNAGFSYNQFLTFIGVLFEENKVVEVKAIQNMLLEKNGRDIIIIDNGGVNLLAENDIIVSLDGKRYWTDIKEILNKKDTKTNVFSVLRNGEKKTVRVNGKNTISIRKRYVLSFFETLSNEQKANWLAYLN